MPPSPSARRPVEPASDDLAIGAFTERGPWLVDPERLAWAEGLDDRRRQLPGEVATLLAPARVPPIARALRVSSSIGWALGCWYRFERGTPRSRAGLSRRLRRSFERLGSSYVKLGQIVSGGEGLFPDELVREFTRLRDQVPPEPFAVVREVVEADLGAPLARLFASFDQAPIAAASIAQVHGARLHSGEDVVVKVQRPQVAARVRSDIRALSWLAPRLIGRIPVAALANPPALVELFAETILEELDFRLEAQNMLDIARVLAETDQRTMVVPRPHPTLVTRRVLVMERLHGFAFDDVASMHAAGIDTTALLRAGLIASLEGAMLHGVFHGDLHGGNLMVQPDGRTALFDFGITGRLGEPQRIAFLRLLISGTAGNTRGQLVALRDLGAFPGDTDIDAVYVDLGLDQPIKDASAMSADELVGELRELTKRLLDYGARAPKELMLFVKNMMFLNSATATLAPDLDLFGEVLHVHAYFAAVHGERILREVGIDPSDTEIDLDAVKAGFGVPADVERLTFRELQERRQLILGRVQARQDGGRRGVRRGRRLAARRTRPGS